MGVVVFPLLPVAPLPQVDFPTIQVSASLPGASPETMASSVATPLETQFAQIPGLSQMTSTNALGTTQITLQFDLNRNIDAAAQDVQSGIDAAGGQLPKNLPTPPNYRKVNPADSSILILSVFSDVLPVTTVDDYAENILAQQISQISGHRAGQHRRPAEAGGARAGRSHQARRAGIANGRYRRCHLAGHGGRAQGFDQRPAAQHDDLRQRPVAEGRALERCGGGLQERRPGAHHATSAWRSTGRRIAMLTAWQNGRNGILLLIYKQPGANVIDAVERVQALLPHALASVPPSIKVDTVANRTTTIKASVEDVEITLGITIVLVVMVIFLFLRNAWATIIPGVTVPLALFGTVAMMYVLNFSLDNLSLMALTIAVGFVVDDAIVMLENVYRHIEAGLIAAAGDPQGRR